MEGFNLTTLMKRLEAATSRLEDIVVFSEQHNGGPSSSGSATSKEAAPVAPSAPATSASGSIASTASPAGSSSAAPSTGVSEVKKLVSQLDEFVSLSAKIDEGVAKQAEEFRAAAQAMADVVATAQVSSTPSVEQLMQLLTPLNEHAAKTDTLRDELRSKRELTNYLATVPAGVQALGWVSIEGKGLAAGFVQEMRDSAQFYANRVLKDNKDAKPWVQAYVQFLTGLKDVVAKEYPEGLQWNPNGAPVGSAATPAPAAPAASGGGPPPPPPPPSVAQLTADIGSAPSAAAPPAGAGMGGVFAELSQGESIASGLKKTDRQALKAQKPPVPKKTKPRSGAGDSSPATSRTAASTKKLVPRVELVESKWHVEDLNDRHDVEIEASLGQSVQIDNCQNTTVKIHGKAATFAMSRCKKIGLLVDDMVASCDVVNCSDFGVQVTNRLPSLMIDQSHNGHIYLSEASLDLDIFTSQTTGININIPEGEPGAYREVPLGEQIQHNIVGDKVQSTVVKHG